MRWSQKGNLKISDDNRVWLGIFDIDDSEWGKSGIKFLVLCLYYL